MRPFQARNSSRLESALDRVDDVVRTSQRTESPAREPERRVTEQLAHTSLSSPSDVAGTPEGSGGDTLERRRRERAAKRAAEAEVQRLEDEKAAVSLERRRVEREARRKAREGIAHARARGVVFLVTCCVLLICATTQLRTAVAVAAAVMRPLSVASTSVKSGESRGRLNEAARRLYKSVCVCSVAECVSPESNRFPAIPCRVERAAAVLVVQGMCTRCCAWLA